MRYERARIAIRKSRLIRSLVGAHVAPLLTLIAPESDQKTKIGEAVINVVLIAEFR